MFGLFSLTELGFVPEWMAIGALVRKLHFLSFSLEMCEIGLLREKLSPMELPRLDMERVTVERFTELHAHASVLSFDDK